MGSQSPFNGFSDSGLTVNFVRVTERSQQSQIFSIALPKNPPSGTGLPAY
jgi:hypothetical protein